MHGWLWADQIHFSQTSIKATFQNGGSLEHLEAELRRDGRAILCIGLLNVVLHLGKWFTRDNRRLYAIKRVAPDCLVPVAFGTVDRLFLSHFTTQNGGSSIYVRGARAARSLCRTSFRPPHMGLACDGGGLPARPPKGSIAQFILARVCSKRVWGGLSRGRQAGAVPASGRRHTAAAGARPPQQGHSRVHRPRASQPLPRGHTAAAGARPPQQGHSRAHRPRASQPLPRGGTALAQQRLASSAQASRQAGWSAARRAAAPVAPRAAPVMTHSNPATPAAATAPLQQRQRLQQPLSGNDQRWLPIQQRQRLQQPLLLDQRRLPLQQRQRLQQPVLSAQRRARPLRASFLNDTSGIRFGAPSARGCRRCL